jgi:hypothetical protein
MTEIQKSFALSEDAVKLLDCISLLSNLLTNKNANDELKKMFRNKNVKELFKDRFVFFSAMQKLTFYKFRHQARKIIFSYFDTFM